MFADCPVMTIAALEGTVCAQNGDIIIKEPTDLPFTCSYQTQGRQTAYSWYLDDTQIAGLSTSDVVVSIPSGSHSVSCEAVIDVSDIVPAGSADDCSCVERSTLNVTVIGT